MIKDVSISMKVNMVWELRVNHPSSKSYKDENNVVKDTILYYNKIENAMPKYMFKTY